MSLSTTEEEVLNRIAAWEDRFFQYEPTDFGVLYQSWANRSLGKLSSSWLEKVNMTIDQLVFHLQALIQSTEWLQNAREQLLTESRVFQQDIREVEDLKKLSVPQLAFIAQKHIGKQRLLSTVQGGMTGTGGFFLLTLDVPLSISIQLYAVQLISLTYGNEVALPGEMMTALKVFHIGLLPKRLRRLAWAAIEEEVIKGDINPYFYDGEKETSNPSWFEGGLKQLGKTIVISQLKRKLFQGVPIMGMAVGAGLNYQTTKQVTEVANYFYQKRFLLEKAGGTDVIT